MAMQIGQYGADRIAQYSRSRATLDTIGRRHQASIRLVSPQRTPWNGPSTQLIKATSCVERSNTTIKAEDIANILAIKR
jgi:hypothetical protein